MRLPPSGGENDGVVDDSAVGTQGLRTVGRGRARRHDVVHEHDPNAAEHAGRNASEAVARRQPGRARATALRIAGPMAQREQERPFAQYGESPCKVNALVKAALCAPSGGGWHGNEHRVRIEGTAALCQPCRQRLADVAAPTLVREYRSPQRARVGPDCD